MSSVRKLKVFLCHSSGDKPAVRTLYQRLRADDIEPWLDEEDLLPGQKWEQEIPKAVRAADAILVCLSHGSITKEGYVQKEIMDALDAAKEKPEGTIFLIPLRLEDCEIPDRLKGWQVGNLFEERGYEKLLRALRVRANALGLASLASPAPFIRNSIGMELVLIPAGEFRMGAEDGFDGEKPVHPVHISHPFYLGKYPVTQAQWEVVVVMRNGKNPSHFTGDPSRPVENVSWTDVQEFLRRLSEKEGGKPFTSGAWWKIQEAQRRGNTESCAAVRGALSRGVSVYPSASGTSLATATAVSDFVAPCSSFLGSGCWSAGFWGPGAEAPGRIVEQHVSLFRPPQHRISPCLMIGVTP